MRFRGHVFVVLASTMTLLPAHFAHAGGDLESRLAYLQNRDRTAFGRPALQLSASLSSIARAHAQDMAAAHRIWHDPALPSLVQGWDYVGDNVGRSLNIDQLHAGFLASRAHRENLMFWSYTKYGVGVATSGDGYVYAVVVFLTPYSGRSPQRRTSTPTARQIEAQAPQTIEMLVRVVSLDARAA